MNGASPEKETTPYEDMIRLRRPVSTRHAPMPVSDRAKIFAPFAALKGYEEALAVTALGREAETESARTDLQKRSRTNKLQ